MVMVQDGKIIGQNLFMRARIQTDKGRDKPILTMWPICITPKLKRQGYGKILLGITGEYAPPEVYLVDENRPKNLIKNFSPRKKKRPPPKFLDNPTVLKRLFTQKKKPILIKN